MKRRSSLLCLCSFLSFLCLSCMQGKWDGFFDDQGIVSTQYLPQAERASIRNLTSLTKYLTREQLAQVVTIYLVDIPSIESLAGIEQFPLLRGLSIRRAAIKSLRYVQNARTLDSIEIDECSLGDYSDLVKSTSIRRIDIYPVTTSIIDFSSNHSVKVMIFNTGSFASLEELLPSQFYPASLETLSVANVGLKEIDSFLKTNTQIRDLFVGYNAIEQIDLSLVKAPLTRLSITNNPYVGRRGITEASKIINGVTVWFNEVDSD